MSFARGGETWLHIASYFWSASAGKKMYITAGVTEAKLGCDLLLSCREIAQFVSDGFTFDVR